MSLPAPLTDLDCALRQRASTASTEHRPWPLPESSWLMGQSWFDLLFAHWRVDPKYLREILPPGLEPDVIDGSAWIGLTPFEVRALRLRLTLPAPFVSSFPEINVRTYVTVGGRPGIWFLSLDAGSRLAVLAARRTYRFPYFHARMSVVRSEGAIEYNSERDGASGPPARIAAGYVPEGEPFEAEPGSLDAALTERYCAYTLDERRRVLRAQIHHRPWRLQPVVAEFAENSMTAPFGLDLEGEPLLHYAARQDVVIWPHEVVADS